MTIKKTLEHLDFLQASSGRTCKYLSGKNINIVQLFCLGMLRRIHNTTTANRILYKQFEKNPSLDFSIGISFRALILDYLVSMSVLNEINEWEAEQKNDQEIDDAMKEVCEIFLSDGIRQTLSYIQDAEKLGFTTSKQTVETFKIMGEVYKPFLDNYPGDGTKPLLKHNNQKTAKQLFEILAKTKELKKASTLYDSYAYLSKYDHFGIIYYNAINEPIEKKIGIYFNVSEAIVAH